MLRSSGCHTSLISRFVRPLQAAALAEELVGLIGDAVVAEVLGHTALLYRPSSRRLIELD